MSDMINTDVWGTIHDDQASDGAVAQLRADVYTEFYSRDEVEIKLEQLRNEMERRVADMENQLRGMFWSEIHELTHNIFEFLKGNSAFDLSEEDFFIALET